MIFRDPRFLLAAAALVYSAVPAVAAPASDPASSNRHKPRAPNLDTQSHTFQPIVGSRRFTGPTGITLPARHSYRGDIP